jgi:hypothetical protein
LDVCGAACPEALKIKGQSSDLFIKEGIKCADCKNVSYSDDTEYYRFFCDQYGCMGYYCLNCGLNRLKESEDAKYLKINTDIYSASFMSMITEMNKLPPMPLEELPA